MQEQLQYGFPCHNLGFTQHALKAIWQWLSDAENLLHMPRILCWEREHPHSEGAPTRKLAMSKSRVIKGIDDLSGLKKALLQNPRGMIRGQIFSGMIRIQARKSEIQAESRSYRPKVGDTVQNPNRIAQKRAPNGV